MHETCLLIISIKAISLRHDSFIFFNLLFIRGKNTFTIKILQADFASKHEGETSFFHDVEQQSKAAD
jgi:hypothetical protein